MTIQELAEIAARHHTRMADAMIAACVRHSLETGERLVIPERKAGKRRPRKRQATEDELSHEEWRVMLEHNAEVRAAWHG